VNAVVSAAQGVLVSQPKGSPATKAVLALLAGAHRGLWARVSEHPAGEEVGIAAASGVVPDRDHDCDSDSEREDDDSEPPAQVRPQVLARMGSPSKYLEVARAATARERHQLNRPHQVELASTTAYEIPNAALWVKRPPSYNAGQPLKRKIPRTNSAERR
jgi:hypothetical protein